MITADSPEILVMTSGLGISTTLDRWPSIGGKNPKKVDDAAA
jgi:hypothetical protein